MTIYFIDGTKMKIDQTDAKLLRDRILKGCNNWQWFSDENGEVIKAIVLDKISHIE